MSIRYFVIVNQGEADGDDDYDDDDDNNNNNNNKILNTETGSKCRLCQQFDETADHIISACPILAKEQYIKRT